MADTPHSDAEVTTEVEGSTQADIKDSRPIYEVGYHLLPSIAEAGLSEAAGKVRALLGGAEVIGEGLPQKVTLAYTIERATQGKREKFTNAYFGWVKFVVEDRSIVPALEAALLAMPEVLRSIIIETVREDASKAPRRAVFASDRLEGQTLKKMTEAEQGGSVSDEQLDKSIEALTN